MSEDIDIKMVPNTATLDLSNNQRLQLRREMHQLIINSIAGSDIFELAAVPEKRNQGKHQQFLISYPREHGVLQALRPHLKLDLTESLLLEAPVELPLSSLYARTLNLVGEIQRIRCVTAHSTASEKFVSLLRRTAAYARDNSRVDDKTLIRHVYDLHLIHGLITRPLDLKPMVKQVIEMDKRQYQERYNQFIGPLVYHPAPAKWDDAILSIQSLADDWL